MRILLTADFSTGMFSNGQNQNIFALHDLLRELGHDVILVAEGHALEEENIKVNKKALLNNYEVLSMADVLKKKIKGDIFVQAAICYGEDWIKALRKSSPSLKAVQVCYGPRLFIDLEYCINGSKGGGSPRQRYIDEIWTSPHYDYSIDYYKILNQTENVKFIPYIWSSKTLEEEEKKLNKQEKTCFYSPSEKVNIAITEPNNIVKNCICPALIAEGLHNEDQQAIDSVYVWGGSGLTDENYFSNYFLDLDLVQDKKMKFEERHPFPFIFSEHCNYIVSHQHMNALNYTYLEALYLGIPLIHNSEFIKNEAGYYYPGFALKEGVKALRQAISSHDDNLEEYRKKGEQIIWRYNAKNPAVQQAYKNLL